MRITNKYSLLKKGIFIKCEKDKHLIALTNNDEIYCEHRNVENELYAYDLVEDKIRYHSDNFSPCIKFLANLRLVEKIAPADIPKAFDGVYNGDTVNYEKN